MKTMYFIIKYSWCADVGAGDIVKCIIDEDGRVHTFVKHKDSDRFKSKYWGLRGFDESNMLNKLNSHWGTKYLQFENTNYSEIAVELI